MTMLDWRIQFNTWEMEPIQTETDSTAARRASDVPVIRIRPSGGWISLKLTELWEYRELIYFLMWRDVKVRYKQTVLGVAWAIIQPVATMVIFSLFFGLLAKIPSDVFPYPIFNLVGLVRWILFSHGPCHFSNRFVVV